LVYPYFADYGIEKFVKMLMGRRDIEDGLSQLDTLTREEVSIMAVSNLRHTAEINRLFLPCTGILVFLG